MALHRLSLIEPGPVHTEFEAKMMQDVRQKEYPGTDPETLDYFKNKYLPSAIDIFEMFGQTPDDIARVSPSHLSQRNSPLLIPSHLWLFAVHHEGR